MSTHHNNRRQAGFTLIEILVTVVILAIGLLGIAGMQASGLRNNHAAYTMTQATNLAMDMADRIRANPSGRAEYVGFDSSGTIPAKPTCITTGCTPQQLASYDKYEWSQPLNAANKPLLPDGRGVITQAADEFIVTVLWREPAFQDMTPKKCAGFDAVSDDTACFQMRFIP